MGLFPASAEEMAELQDLCRKVLSSSPYVPGKVWEKAGSYHYVICYAGSHPMLTRAGVIYANVEDMRMYKASNGNSYIQVVHDVQFDERTVETVVALGLDLLGPLKALGEQADGTVP